jgi:hypothetical protein
MSNSECYLNNAKYEKINIAGKDIDCTCTMDPNWDGIHIHYNCYSIVVIGYLEFYDFIRGAWNTMGARRVRQGQWIENYPNHKPRYEGFYKNGLKYGKFTYYRPDGSIDKIIEYHGE